jgi:hypothetical protein
LKKWRWYLEEKTCWLMGSVSHSAVIAISSMYQLFHSGTIQQPVTGRPSVSSP